MMKVFIAELASGLMSIDDAGVNPTTNAPWLDNFFKGFVGQIIGTVLIGLIAVVALSALAAAAGKLFSSHGLFVGGLVAVAISGVAAMLAGGAAAFVMFFFKMPLF